MLREVRERILGPVWKPPPNTKRLTAIMNKLGHHRSQHEKMVFALEREMENTQLTADKLLVNEKGITKLNAEYRASAEKKKAELLRGLSMATLKRMRRAS